MRPKSIALEYHSGQHRRDQYRFTLRVRARVSSSHGRNTHMDELRHMAIRLLHVHSFPTIPGRRNPHDWVRTTLRCCKCLRCGVENVSVEISAGTRNRKCSPPISPHSPEPQLKPGTCPSLVCVASIEIDCVRCLDASEANLLSKRGVWG